MSFIDLHSTQLFSKPAISLVQKKKKKEEQEIISSKKKKTGNSSYQNLNGIIILLDVNNSAVNGHISRNLTFILCPDFTIFLSYNSICKELLSSCLYIVLDFKPLEAMICFTFTFLKSAALSSK